MWDPTQYELLDFGRGRKLEQFAGICTDRLSPAADQALPAHPDLWAAAGARYERTQADRGTWRMRQSMPATWLIEHGELELELNLTPFGHVGVFPEQAGNWDWLAQAGAHGREATEGAQPVRIHGGKHTRGG